MLRNPYQEEWCIPTQRFKDFGSWFEERHKDTVSLISKVLEQTELAITLTELEEVLEVQPLSVVTRPECCKTVEPSEWVLERMEEFSTHMRVSIIGHEEEAMRLFMSIESQWKASVSIGVSVSPPKKKSGSVRKGVRELRNLASSINYEARRRGDRNKVGMERGLRVYQ